MKGFGKSIVSAGAILFVIWLIGQEDDGGNDPASGGAGALQSASGSLASAAVGKAALLDWRRSPTDLADERKSPTIKEIRHVTATSLNLRSGPDTEYSAVEQLQQGTRLTVERQSGSWLAVRAPSGKQGWVKSSYTTKLAPAGPHRTTTARPSAPTDPSTGSRAPSTSDDDIRDELIERSIASYSGNCPCPYNRNSRGNRCGGNSAYSRPNGKAPLCFRDDVSDAMVRAHR